MLYNFSDIFSYSLIQVNKEDHTKKLNLQDLIALHLKGGGGMNKKKSLKLSLNGEINRFIGR